VDAAEQQARAPRRPSSRRPRTRIGSPPADAPDEEDSADPSAPGDCVRVRLTRGRMESQWAPMGTRCRWTAGRRRTQLSLRSGNTSIAGAFQWSQPGSNRRPPACKADRIVRSCLVMSRKGLQISQFCWPREDTKGRRETNWCPPGAPSAFVASAAGRGQPPAARLRQLEDAAAAKAALASAIAVCASSRGISSNSSITWP
jgi:hypothetical protein